MYRVVEIAETPEEETAEALYKAVEECETVHKIASVDPPVTLSK